MRPIDAEKLMDKLFNEWNKHPDRDIRDTTGITIATMPTIDPVKHAHWRYIDYTWYCSNCGKLIATPGYMPGYMPLESELIKSHKYCAYCGAKMDEAVEYETD